MVKRKFSITIEYDYEDEPYYELDKDIENMDFCLSGLFDPAEGFVKCEVVAEDIVC